MNSTKFPQPFFCNLFHRMERISAFSIFGGDLLRELNQNEALVLTRGIQAGNGFSQRARADIEVRGNVTLPGGNSNEVLQEAHRSAM